jgi:peroxiredoxin (alkyl hydroperoxide reductase subunit C)
MSKRKSNAVAASLLSLALILSDVAPTWAQSKQPGEKIASMPKVGDLAPDFKLQYFDSKELKDISLSQYRGKKNVVLAFFIFAFTGG